MVPFRGQGGPKRRLAPLLTLAERRGLAQRMLSDVLEALLAVSGFSRCLVISPDRAALDEAQGLGAAPMLQTGAPGYRAAAEQAAAAAREAGATASLVVPADLPLAAPEDFKQLLAGSRRAAVTIVESSSGGGTNALLTRPPGAIPYLFGPGSFGSHLRIARQRGLKALVLDLPRLALDLDRPDDLRRLFESAAPPTSGGAWRYLTEIGFPERLRRRAGSDRPTEAAPGWAAGRRDSRT